jgi:hypothetical protein
VGRVKCYYSSKEFLRLKKELRNETFSQATLKLKELIMLYQSVNLELNNIEFS